MTASNHPLYIKFTATAAPIQRGNAATERWPNGRKCSTATESQRRADAEPESI